MKNKLLLITATIVIACLVIFVLCFHANRQSENDVNEQSQDSNSSYAESKSQMETEGIYELFLKAFPDEKALEAHMQEKLLDPIILGGEKSEETETQESQDTQEGAVEYISSIMQNAGIKVIDIKPQGAQMIVTCNVTAPNMYDALLEYLQTDSDAIVTYDQVVQEMYACIAAAESKTEPVEVVFVQTEEGWEPQNSADFLNAASGGYFDFISYYYQANNGRDQ